MNKLKLYATGLVMVLSVAFFGLQAAPAYAQFDVTKSAACEGVSANGCDTGSGVSKLIKAAVNILSIIVGVAAVIMIIISGLRYVTSGGDSSSVSAAKRSLLYAVVGLVITAMAQFIVRFVFDKIK